MKAQGFYKGGGRAFPWRRTKDSEQWSEEDFAWWNKGKKGLSTGNDGFQKGGFRPFQPDNGAVKDSSQNKGKARFQQGKGKEEAHGLSASEKPEEEGCSHAWRSDDWSSSQWLDDSWTQAAGWTRVHTARMAVPSLDLAYHQTHVVLDLGCTRSRSAFKRFLSHAWYFLALQGNSAVVTNLSCFPIPRQNLARKVALITLQQHQHVQTLLTFLRQVMYLFCWFHFLRWESWVRLLIWILKETRLHAQLWACPDLTNLDQSIFGQSNFGSGVCHGGARKGVGPNPQKSWAPK